MNSLRGKRTTQQIIRKSICSFYHLSYIAIPFHGRCRFSWLHESFKIYAYVNTMLSKTIKQDGFLSFSFLMPWIDFRKSSITHYH